MVLKLHMTLMYNDNTIIDIDNIVHRAKISTFQTVMYTILRLVGLLMSGHCTHWQAQSLEDSYQVAGTEPHWQWVFCFCLPNGDSLPLQSEGLSILSSRSSYPISQAGAGVLFSPSDCSQFFKQIYWASKLFDFKVGPCYVMFSNRFYWKQNASYSDSVFRISDETCADL
jgi:hypothetical protein